MQPIIMQKAPDFSLDLLEDKTVHLKNFVGQNLLLYFYPKDDTPGCTIEAKEFQEAKEEFAKYDITIIGVSKDNIKSHNKFKEKYCLTFDLGVDPTGKIYEDYGVWVEKSMYGKKYMGIDRVSFLINKEGIISHIWPKVKPAGHAAEILTFIKNTPL